MKKHLIILSFLLFLSSSMQALTPKRWAQCAFRPKKHNCSTKERSTAKKWLIGSSIAAVGAAAAASGIAVTPSLIRAQKEDVIIDISLTNLNKEFEQLYKEYNSNFPKIENIIAAHIVEKSTQLKEYQKEFLAFYNIVNDLLTKIGKRSPTQKELEYLNASINIMERHLNMMKEIINDQN